MYTKSMIHLNKVLTSKLVKACKDKKVLFALSGGLDTRAMLSILIRQGIHVDTFTFNTSRKDIQLSKRIVNLVDIIDHHYIWDISDDKQVKEKLRVFSKDYDLVVNGVWISGYFDKFERLYLSERQLDDIICREIKITRELKEQYKFMYFPILERELREAVYNLNLFYRFFSYPQRCIIMLNYPSLLRIGFTSYSIPKKIARRLYWMIAWCIEFYLSKKYKEELL